MNMKDQKVGYSMNIQKSKAFLDDSNSQLKIYSR